MSAATYAMTPPSVMVDGVYSPMLLLRDGDEPNERLFVDLEVSSGDYFATLATQLDNLSQHFEAIEYEAIQELVTNLLYLQDKYRIVKK